MQLVTGNGQLTECTVSHVILSSWRGRLTGIFPLSYFSSITDSSSLLIPQTASGSRYSSEAPLAIDIFTFCARKIMLIN